MPIPSCGVETSSSPSVSTQGTKRSKKSRVFCYTNRGKKRSNGKRDEIIARGAMGVTMARSLISGAIRREVSEHELRKNISWESVSSIRHGAKSEADNAVKKGGNLNSQSHVVLPTYDKGFKRKLPSTSSISSSSNESEPSSENESSSKTSSTEEDEKSKPSTLDDSFRPAKSKRSFSAYSSSNIVNKNTSFDVPNNKPDKEVENFIFSDGPSTSKSFEPKPNSAQSSKNINLVKESASLNKNEKLTSLKELPSLNLFEAKSSPSQPSKNIDSDNNVASTSKKLVENKKIVFLKELPGFNPFEPQQKKKKVIKADSKQSTSSKGSTSSRSSSDGDSSKSSSYLSERSSSTENSNSTETSSLTSIDSKSSGYIEPLTDQQVADILEKSGFGQKNKNKNNQPPFSKRHEKNRSQNFKKLESASSWETVCSLRDEIFTENRMNLKTSKKKNTEENFKIRREKRKSKSEKSGPICKRIKTEKKLNSRKRLSTK